ncbi:MAG: lamin tail domain-containing protein [Bacteroidetes bacterium]|nr:lamin tail domain-containing protein [Bacteroidota bacterium]
MKHFSKLTILLFALSLFFVGCSEDDGVNPIQTESEYQLFVNEIMTKTSVTIRDENGESGDWFEIYNASGEEANLNGFTITYEYINSGSPVSFEYLISNEVSIQAGGFLLIWCDGNNNGLHTNFDLKAGKGGIIRIIDPLGFVVDEKDYSDTEVTLNIDDISIARVPDGSDNWQPFGVGYSSWATPNQSNSEVIAPPSLPSVFINELMAKNATTITDANGNNSDWIELYNDEDTEIDITNWTVKYEYENNGTPVIQEYTISENTSIPINGFLLIWCDGSGSGLFTNFDLKTQKGGTVTILDANDELIDFVTYTGTDITTGTDDLSYGRKNDGGGNWMTFGTGYERMPSPGSSNR